MSEVTGRGTTNPGTARRWWGASIAVAVGNGLAFLLSMQPPDGARVIDALGVAWFVAGLVMSAVVTIVFGAAIPVLVLRGGRRHRRPPWIFLGVTAVVAIQWLSRALAP